MLGPDGWLEPELPRHASDLSERGKERLLAHARMGILQRTYTGTFAYPIFAVVVGWIVGLTHEYPRALAMVTAVLAVIVVVRVFLYRRAIAATTRPSLAGKAHLLLGVASAAILASAIGCAFVVREADAAMTAGYVMMAGIAGTVVMIASTHRTLATVWVLASIVPGLIVFVIEGGTTSRMMFAMYVLYLPILRKMIAKGHEAYWDAQVNAVRLDEQAHELARLSRLAGMAENATNVLHDVGNALNVVKTSAQCLERHHANHSVHDVARLAELLAPHAADLPRFFAADPRGAHVFPFLDALAKSGVTHAQAARAELDRLRASLEHIETIVFRQQDVAKGVKALESCAVADLVGDAIGLSSLGRHKSVSIERSIAPGLRVSVDRHRALQVLVNLLENAADAVATVERSPRIRIDARAKQGHHVVVEITDNGCGIAPEVAARVFTHGFTTKPHGHGFGLHGSFVLVQAMGGELSFSSEGPGRGTTFRVCLLAAER